MGKFSIDEALSFAIKKEIKVKKINRCAGKYFMFRKLE
jgi:hypothetical protein